MEVRAHFMYVNCYTYMEVRAHFMYVNCYTYMEVRAHFMYVNCYTYMELAASPRTCNKNDINNASLVCIQREVHNLLSSSYM